MGAQEDNRKPIRIIGSDGDISGPFGIAFYNNGLWAIADNARGCVHIYKEKKSIRTVKDHDGILNNPHGIAIDKSNNYLYVAEFGSNRIQVFDASIKPRIKFGSQSSGKPGFCGQELYWPAGITIHNNEVFVAEAKNGRISVFDTNGDFKRIIGYGKLIRPFDVAVANDGQILVADCAPNAKQCIRKYSLAGIHDDNFSIVKPGHAKDQLRNPHSLTIDSDGLILVADSGNNRVSVFKQDGTFDHCFGIEGTDDGQFKHPQGVALSPNGKLYVSDRDNHRVQVFDYC